MRKDIRLELRGAEPKGAERGATIAFTISYRGQRPADRRPRHQHAGVLLHRGEPEGPRAAGHRDRRLPPGPARRRRRRKLDAAGAAGQRVQEAPRRASCRRSSRSTWRALERLNAQLRLNNDNQTRAPRAAGDPRPPDGREPASGAARHRCPRGRLAVVVDPPAARLARLRQELAELRTRFSDQYPDVVRRQGRDRRPRAEVASAAQRGGARRRRGPPRPAGPADPAPPAAAGHRRGRRRAQDPQGRGASASATPSPSTSSGSQNTPVREQEFKELSRDYDSTKELLRLAPQALRRGPDRREHGAAPEGRAVPDPRAGDAAPTGRIAPNRPRLLGDGPRPRARPGGRPGPPGRAARHVLPHPRRPPRVHAVPRCSRASRAS